jgi:hypothetical protein
MSGYLQRLLNSTAGRPDAIHPRTGSIFSPPYDASSPLQRAEESQSVTAAQPRVEQQTQAADAGHAESRHHITREFSYEPLLPAAEAPSHGAALPMQPASRAVVSDGGEPTAARVLKPGQPPRGHDIAVAETSIAVQPARDAENTVRPLMVASRAGDAVAHAAEPQRISNEPHTDRTDRQADDIQIHIGRIEVVAISPPPPRVPKAPDRSLSLDEYLSRRDRRPR